ncbi:MAG: hypothetical protein Q8O27_00005 [Enterobacteriaceae bacterium]|nr:hypothetical protein [Enterobacteriaceae bacterium]
MLASRDISLAVIHHPELSLMALQTSDSAFSNAVSSFYVLLKEFMDAESLYIPCLVFIHFMLFLLIVSFFVMFYFSYFTTSTKEETTIDYDYMTASGSVEAEKEISSYDDICLSFITFFFMFC